MSERSEYAPGEFRWVDLAVPDVEAATNFYGELLGWEAQSAGPVEETGGYGFFVRDGKQVAGFGPLMAEGQHPAWNSYVNVADADATLAKVTEAGGTAVMGPIEIPNDSGRMAVLQDPAGAFLSIFEAKKHPGAELVNEVGTWTWNQLATRDIDQARDFYGQAFGWRLEQAEAAAAAGVPYFMWQGEGQKWDEGLAGAMLMGEEMPAEVPPHWQVYFAVESADDAIETTKRAGGSLLFGPQEIPVGKLAVLNDPQGAGFAILEPDYPEER
jgi:predicted enzyme related to lactoylglutathione lyase